MQNIEKVIKDLQTRLFLTKQIKAREDSTLEIGGFTARVEATPGFHINGIVELAKIMNVPVQVATIQGDEIRPYMAYIDLYENRFYDFVSPEEYLQLERKE